MAEVALKEELIVEIECVKPEVHAKLIAYLDRSGTPIDIFSNMIEVPTRNVSQYIEQNFSNPNILFTVQQKIEAFLRRHEHSNLLPEDPIFTTTHFIETFETLRLGHVMSCMVLITGLSGVGKTTAANAYKKKFNDTIIITAGVTRVALGTVLAAIAEKLGVKYYSSQTNSVYLQAIIECLRQKTRMLIIDEAHFLRWEAFEAIRQIWDEAKTGIAYVGMPRLYDQMRGRSNKFLYDQIFSRIGIKRNLGTAIERPDAELIAKSLYPDLDKKSIDFLYKKASGDGKFRTMINLLKLAEQIGRVENKPISLGLLKEASHFLIE